MFNAQISRKLAVVIQMCYVVTDQIKTYLCAKLKNNIYSIERKKI